MKINSHVPFELTMLGSLAARASNLLRSPALVDLWNSFISPQCSNCVLIMVEISPVSAKYDISLGCGMGGAANDGAGGGGGGGTMF